MDEKHILREITDLSDKIRLYQKEYYIDNRPSVTDKEYDGLFDRLLVLEKKYPHLVMDDSPSRRVGSDMNRDFPEVKHTIPVLSLDKCYSPSDLTAWMEKASKTAGRALSFVVEQKIDGASLVLYYEKGKLARAVTRGNGVTGNDVMANVMTIPSVPLKLSRPVTMAIRGEVYLPIKYFNEINSRMSVPYANPRNLASGSLRRVKSAEVAKIPLDIFLYEGFFREPLPTHVETIEVLSGLGFKINKSRGYFSDADSLDAFRREHPDFTAGPVGKIGDFIKEQSELRSSLGYEIDGLVIKVNEIDVRETLGYTGHHPRWAMAFKFESPVGVTSVKDILVQIGRTGRATPVAVVDGVQISGSVITRVTLHNQEYVDALELGIGDEVTVSKRGDVIPSVEYVTEHRADSVWKMPGKCPSCGKTLERKGAHHFCVNPDCRDQLLGRLVFFASKGQMDIDNLGEETLARLFEMGLVRAIEDIYSFDPEKLREETGFGEKKIALIRDGIGKSLTKDFKTVLKSLGIPELGAKVAELLTENGYDTIEALYEAVDRADPEVFTRIAGIGPQTARMLVEELSKPSLRTQVESLRRAGLSLRQAAGEGREQFDPVFGGQSWCVTGSFISFKPRELAMDEVKKRGGRVVSGVTARTTHLLAGSGAGTKLDKANELSVTVVTEEEFLRLIGRG